VTTTESNLTKDMTPVEAANLLAKLEDGHQAAWLSTRETRWPSAQHEARFQNAADIDDVFRDLMWETLENGMRRPGELVEHFAERPNQRPDSLMRTRPVAKRLPTSSSSRPTLT